VEENAIGELLASASVMVMPYSSAAGSSGVAHMACEYGLPIVCADIADFREMGADEQFAINFFKTGDAHSMADSIVNLLEDPVSQFEMAEANFAVALRQTMPMIIRQYLHSFTVEQRQSALRPLSRFRRLPGWVPLRSAIFRAAAPRWSQWT
jgi:glycosyltransferase involved in cell wall biosynthesis